MARGKTLRRLPDGEAHSVRVDKTEEGYRVVSEAPRLEAAVSRAASGIWSVLTEDGVSHEALVERDDGELRVIVDHRVFRFASGDAAVRAAAVGASSGRAEVKAPMPGKIVKLLVSEGEPVTAGQGVMLFEAMKMQNEIKSPREGVLAELAVAEGQAVEARTRLFVVEPAG